MNTTGLLAAARISLTASIPRPSVFQLNVGHDQLRLSLRRQGDRLAMRARDSDHVMAEILDNRLEIHGYDRLVLDDEDARGEFIREISSALCEQGDNTRGIRCP